MVSFEYHFWRILVLLFTHKQMGFPRLTVCKTHHENNMDIFGKVRNMVVFPGVLATWPFYELHSTLTWLWKIIVLFSLVAFFSKICEFLPYMLVLLPHMLVLTLSWERGFTSPYEFFKINCEEMFYSFRFFLLLIFIYFMHSVKKWSKTKIFCRNYGIVVEVDRTFSYTAGKWYDMKRTLIILL